MSDDGTLQCYGCKTVLGAVPGRPLPTGQVKRLPHISVRLGLAFAYCRHCRCFTRYEIAPPVNTMDEDALASVHAA